MPPPDPNLDPPPEPLGYRDGRDDRPSREAMVPSVIGGAALSAALEILCVIIWVGAILRNGNSSPPAFWWAGSLGATLGVLAALTTLNWWAWRRGNRGFVIGVLLGLAASGLLEGLCVLARVRI